MAISIDKGSEDIIYESDWLCWNLYFHHFNFALLNILKYLVVKNNNIAACPIFYFSSNTSYVGSFLFYLILSPWRGVPDQ